MCFALHLLTRVGVQWATHAVLHEATTPCGWNPAVGSRAASSCGSNTASTCCKGHFKAGLICWDSSRWCSHACKCSAYVTWYILSVQLTTIVKTGTGTVQSSLLAQTLLKDATGLQGLQCVLHQKPKKFRRKLQGQQGQGALTLHVHKNGTRHGRRLQITKQTHIRICLSLYVYIIYSIYWRSNSFSVFAIFPY